MQILAELAFGWFFAGLATIACYAAQVPSPQNAAVILVFGFSATVLFHYFTMKLRTKL